MVEERIDNEVKVALAQTILGAVFDESFRRINHEDASASCCAFLVNNDDAGWNTGAIEQVGGQTDNAFDVSAFHYFFTDVAFGVTAK